MVNSKRLKPAASEYQENRGFSLLEVMISVSVLMMLMAMIFIILDSISKVVNRAKATTASFENARAAFSAMTTRLSEATLNPYKDYVNADGYGRPLPEDDPTTTEDESKTPGGSIYPSGQTYLTFIPAAYQRFSDLHFIAGPASEIMTGIQEQVDGMGTLSGHSIFFQLPMGYSADPTNKGLLNLVNTAGFFLEFNSDTANLPALFAFLGLTPQPTYRYRLMELMQPAEKMSLYRVIKRMYTDRNPSILWLQPDVMDWVNNRHVLAENIIALIFLCESATISPGYVYDSKSYILDPPDNPLDSTDPKNQNRNRLPKTVRVILVTVDEGTSVRYNAIYKDQPPFGSSGVYDATELFQDPEKLEEDLTSLEDKLKELKVEYRIFSREIVMRGAE